MNKHVMSALIAIGALGAAAGTASADDLSGVVTQVNTFQHTGYYGTTAASTFLVRQPNYSYQWVSLLRAPYSGVTALSAHKMKLRLSLVTLCSRSESLKLSMSNLVNTPGGLVAGNTSHFVMTLDTWVGWHDLA